MKGPFVSYNGHHSRMETDSDPVFVVHRIAAGGDHCFVIGTGHEVWDLKQFILGKAA